MCSNNLNYKGVQFRLNIRLKVRSTFKNKDISSEKFIELFNYKLLKIIINLENQGGEN